MKRIIVRKKMKDDELFKDLQEKVLVGKIHNQKQWESVLITIPSVKETVVSLMTKYNLSSMEVFTELRFFYNYPEKQ